MIQIIAFSFNRAMQLDTLLSSLINHWKNPGFQVDVVYNYSSEEYGRGYQLLQEKFNHHNVFLHQESINVPDRISFKDLLIPDNAVRYCRNKKLRKPRTNFRSLTIDILSRSSSDNVMFLTDDSMFVSDINLQNADIDWINQNPQKRQFSLRLGKGVSSLPSSITENNCYCQWDMFENTGNWGYPFSVDAHIYNKQFVLNLLKKYIFCNPNTLESNVVSSVKRLKLLQKGRCFKDIKMLTFPINIVQDSVDNICQNVSVEMLNQRYLQGDRLEYVMDEDYNAMKQYVTQIKFIDNKGIEERITISDDIIRPNISKKEGAIDIIVAGDYSPKERIQKAIDKNEWQDLFPGIANLLSQADYSIVNFESTIAEKADKPIRKIGSHLSTGYHSMYVLKRIGFRMITLANNHSLDYGSSGLLRTIKEANLLGIDTVGAGKNLEAARNVKILSIKGQSIAFINACEHEFSIAKEDSAGANPLDVIELSRQIKQYKNRADYVLLIIHGGVEHYQLPTQRMKNLYRFFVDCGADAIINHHQHCFSGYEIYSGKPIFYGIGNFCFDSASDNELRHATYNYGYMVNLRLHDGKIDFEVYPYEQCYQKAGVYLLTNRKEFDEQIKEINAIISDDSQLLNQFHQMAINKTGWYTDFLRPYNNRFLSSLNARGLFPSLINKDKKEKLLAKINCESHLDILKMVLNKPFS